MNNRTSNIILSGEKTGYNDLLGGISDLLEKARRAAARTVNTFLIATYWEIGRRIVEFEQRGKGRASYGDKLLKRLLKDLSGHFGKGFGLSNLKLIRKFYLIYEDRGKSQTMSGFFPAPASNQKDQTASAVAHYALGSMNNKVFASRNKLQIPDPEILVREIEAERGWLEQRRN